VVLLRPGGRKGILDLLARPGEVAYSEGLINAWGQESVETMQLCINPQVETRNTEGLEEGRWGRKGFGDFANLQVV